MSKKMVTLILIFTIFFSVIAIGVWGKAAEVSGDVYVESMNFYTQEGVLITEVNDSDAKEKKVTLQKDDNNSVSYTFQVELLPANATDLTIEYILENGDASITKIDKLENKDDSNSTSEKASNIFTYTINFNTQGLTTLSFTSNFSGTRRIKDYLLFVFEGSSHGGHIDI